MKERELINKKVTTKPRSGMTYDRVDIQHCQNRGIVFEHRIIHSNATDVNLIGTEQALEEMLLLFCLNNDLYNYVPPKKRRKVIIQII